VKIRFSGSHILLLIFLFISGIPAFAGDGVIQMKNGVADLRGVDFTHQTITLGGECRFAWNQLLQPGQENRLTHSVTYPDLWNRQIIDGQQLSSRGSATYGFTLILPARRPAISVNIPTVYCAYRLYLNGREVASNGKTALTPSHYSPAWVPVILDIPEKLDTLNLLFQVSNFSHNKGGLLTGMQIASQSAMHLQQQRTLAADFLLAGCLFMGGLFFLGLFVFGTKDRATLFFSLFCILYSYRMVGTGEYSLHTAFPALKWELTVRLEYLSLFGSVLLFFQYIRYLYPKDVHLWLIKGVKVVCGLLCITTILTPSLFFTSLLHGFLLMVLGCIVYLVSVFIKAYRRKRVAAGFGLMSVGILMGIQVMVELEYFGLAVSSKLLTFAGHVLFFFLQSLILSFRFSYSLKKSRREAVQGLKAKSEFLSTMSHEIRTPLNSVIGMSNLMLRNNPRPDQQEHLNVLQFSARNLLSIVNDILDYNKIEAGKISFERIEMNLREIANMVVAGATQAASDKGIGVRFTADSSLDRYVLGDPTRLSQVLHNLVNNAVKFTKEGEVVLELTVLDKRKDSVSILFTVQDTGIGIPPEKQQLIFERFTQADSSTSRSFGGTGLGLAISQGILHLQGSKLMLNSEMGKGSTFFFTLSFPLGALIPAEKPMVAETVEKPAEKPLNGIHILLVEDNRINVLVARNFLENWGATITVAENGQEALDRLASSDYHLVLMDLHMPVMDGYTAIRKIREQGMKIPVIALTASLPNEVEQECRGMEIDGFVLKPFLPDELFCKVQQSACRTMAD